MKHITHDERVLMRNVWEHLNTVYVKHGSLDLAYSQYHDLKDGCDFHEKLASTSVFLRHTLHTCIRDLFTSVFVWLSWHLHISHLVQSYFINQNFVVLEFFFLEKLKEKPFTCHMEVISTISLKSIDIFVTYAVALTSVKTQSILPSSSAKSS